MIQQETESVVSESAPDELLLGRYLPEREAGSGGFAQVIVAWDTRIQRRVAIKCLPIDDATDVVGPAGGSILVESTPFDPDVIPGLEEARTAALLSDVNIVQVYDFEVQGDVAYLILEYVDGMTLADLLDFHADDVDAHIVAAIFKGVAHAVEVAHAHHVLHLDIKPANVLIDRAGHIKVTDFGLARLAGESGYGTAAGGTIGYMPPEQMCRADLDERCDEWALASLTYELISGRNPFIADSLAAAEDAIYDTELVIPSLCLEGLDERIDDILFCALDPNREGRYDTVEEFAAQLQPCLGSPRKGTNALKRLIGTLDSSEEEGAIEDDADFEATEDEDASKRSVIPRHLTARSRAVIARIWSAVSSGLSGMVCIEALSTASSVWGEPAAWGVLAAFIALGALVPRVAALVCAEAIGVTLCALGAGVPGVVLMAAVGLWWGVSGRRSIVASNCGISPVVFGLCGCAPGAAVLAGLVLAWREAVASSAFAVLFMTILEALAPAVAPFGWAFPLTQDMGAVVDRLAFIVSCPSAWIVAASWIIAAYVLSILGAYRHRVLRVLGAVFAGASLIGGTVAAYLVAAPTTGSVALDPFALAAVIVSSLATLVAACVGEPRRSGKMN